MKLIALFLCLWVLSAAGGSLSARATDAAGALATLQAGWRDPARTYKPHTRWWWPGNALTKADITWQLEQMAAQGIGGVEIASVWKMYEKGNIEYLSPDYLALVKHAVSEAKRLNLEVAISFCPGWGFGGSWVPPSDQSKKLSVGTLEVPGGTVFSGPLPAAEPDLFNSPYSSDPGTVVAVVAARVMPGNRLDPGSLMVLTDKLSIESHRLAWQAPPGQWRLMAFWLTRTGQQSSAQSFDPPPMEVDLLSRGAVQRYCDHLGEALASAVGPEFGRTVDSLFSDSCETVGGPNSTLWSTDTLARFREQIGYDLTPYLPALWFDCGPLTPRLRYDVGLFLSNLGLNTFYRTFTEWSKVHGIQARIQPHYRFTNELEQGAGASTRPETEVTTARFEPMADPRMTEASGARFYGRAILSAEAYTFLHSDRYRTTLEEMKIATDAFLRDGVTQFYNHAFFGSPERHVAPSRDMPWANRIDPWSPWWKYYHELAAYVARSCFLLRQGRFVADIAVYTPQATAWSERAIWGIDRRILHYGNLPKTLVANGYNFDLINDDLLQHHATFQRGELLINGYSRRILILPKAVVVPIETMRAIEAFARAGGTVIALERLPEAAAGMADHEARDRELRGIVGRIFGTGGESGQRGVYLPGYQITVSDFSPLEQPYQPTPPLNSSQRQLLAALRQAAPPDFELAQAKQSDGLTFIHQRMKETDVYFVSNLEPKPIVTTVTFGVGGRTVQRWDPMTGEITAVAEARPAGRRTSIPVDFAPWESAFFVFAAGAPSAPPTKPASAFNPLPPPIEIAGPWQMSLRAYGFDTFITVQPALASWTAAPRTRHFSGTGRYDTNFTFPADRRGDGTRLMLDLGRVGSAAEVEVNGRPAGVAWTEPFRLDVSRHLRPGNNHLTVFVTNTLINYVTGLARPPEVPLELQSRLGRANPAVYPLGNETAQLSMKETNLPPSGLLGPVRIVSLPSLSAAIILEPARP